MLHLIRALGRCPQVALNWEVRQFGPSCNKMKGDLQKDEQKDDLQNDPALSLNNPTVHSFCYVETRCNWFGVIACKG